MNTVRVGKKHRDKTQAYLEGKGFSVAVVEFRTTYRRGGGRCRDTWGADLIAKDKRRLWFIQVKAARKRKDGSVVKDLEGPVREFSKFRPWPRSVRLYVSLCVKGTAVPTLIDVTKRVLSVL